MPRCPHTYRVGSAWQAGPHAEVRCRLKADHNGLCEIREPRYGVTLQVSSRRPHNVTLTPPNLVPLPVPGPFGPEIRLPAGYTSWAQIEELCRLVKEQKQKPPDEVPS